MVPPPARLPPPSPCPPRPPRDTRERARVTLRAFLRGALELSRSPQQRGGGGTTHSTRSVWAQDDRSFENDDSFNDSDLGDRSQNDDDFGMSGDGEMDGGGMFGTGAPPVPPSLRHLAAAHLCPPSATQRIANARANAWRRGMTSRVACARLLEQDGHARARTP